MWVRHNENRTVAVRLFTDFWFPIYQPKIAAVSGWESHCWLIYMLYLQGAKEDLYLAKYESKYQVQQAQ